MKGVLTNFLEDFFRGSGPPSHPVEGKPRPSRVPTLEPDFFDLNVFKTQRVLGVILPLKGTDQSQGHVQMSFDTTQPQVQRLLALHEYQKAEKILRANRPTEPKDRLIWMYLMTKSQLGNGNPDSAVRTVQDAQRLLSEIEGQEVSLLARKFSVAKADAYSKMGEMHKAFPILENLIGELETKTILNNDELDVKASAFASMAQVLWFGGDLPRSLHYRRRALSLRKSLRNPEDIAVALNGLGVVYRAQGRLNKALETFREVQALQDKIKNQHTLAILNTNVGMVYFEKRKYELAEDKFFKAMLIRKEMDNQFEVADAVFHLVRVQLELGKLKVDESIKESFPKPPYSQPAIAGIEKMIKALIAKGKGDLDDAQQAWQEALATPGLDFSHQILCYEGMAEIGLRKWSKRRNDFLILTEVHSQLDRLQMIALKNFLVASLSKAHLLQAKLSIATSEFKKAEDELSECLNLANRHDLEMIKILGQLEIQKLREKRKAREVQKAEESEGSASPQVEEDEIAEIQRMLMSLG